MLNLVITIAALTITGLITLEMYREYKIQRAMHVRVKGLQIVTPTKRK